ncbi:hypothetical protein Cyast_0795 [Cyanobacterium stanieri PCC 7202]|uniref:Uncharacterized protein n=1 Tax=Cyanobacterium stanieri (strain ATCC 29140 / PCC 7202) TaxID=292563 RepID=K9YJX1_CYASC|nr:hypothetical protein Cyast_0795 [Cyanobacterium stanieri PCC 7202]
MLKTITGIYQQGKINISQYPENIKEGTQVIITFLESNQIDLESRGINKQEAQNIRENLSIFEDDWTKEEMNIYDDYEQHKANLE